MAESVQSTTSTNAGGIKFCVICCSEANDKIVKDEKFLKMLNVYWNAIMADVKPDLNKSFFLCLPCFDNVIELNQINDILVCFEDKLKEMQKKILRKNVKGIVACQEKGLKLHSFQVEIMNEWGTNLKSLAQSENDPKETLVKVTLTKEDSPNSNNVTGTPSKRVQTQPSTVVRTSKRKKTKKRYGSHTSNDEDSNFSDDEVADLGPVLQDEPRRERSSRIGKIVAAAPNNSSGVECRICCDTFPSYSECSKHVRQHKVGENDGKYECRHCFSLFDRKAKILDHKKHCNDADADQNSD